MAQIIINSKQNSFGYTELFNQGLELDGPFGDTFKIFASEDQQVQAFYVLTPEIKNIMLNFPEFDYEFMDEYLNIVAKGNLFNASEQFERLTGAMENLRRALLGQNLAPSLNDSAPQSSLAEAQSTQSPNVRGPRIKNTLRTPRRFFMLIIFLVMLLFYFVAHYLIKPTP